MSEMNTRLSELTVEQFTEIMIAVVGQVLDEKEGKPKSSEDSEELRKKKIEAILGI